MALLRDAAFAAAWDEAWEIGTDYLEDLALKGAELDTQSGAIARLRAVARRPGLTLLTATREPALSHAEVLRKLQSEPDRCRR